MRIYTVIKTNAINVAAPKCIIVAITLITIIITIIIIAIVAVVVVVAINVISITVVATVDMTYEVIAICRIIIVYILPACSRTEKIVFS